MYSVNFIGIPLSFCLSLSLSLSHSLTLSLSLSLRVCLLFFFFLSPKFAALLTLALWSQREVPSTHCFTLLMMPAMQPAPLSMTPSAPNNQQAAPTNQGQMVPNLDCQVGERVGVPAYPNQPRAPAPIVAKSDATSMGNKVFAATCRAATNSVHFRWFETQTGQQLVRLRSASVLLRLVDACHEF